MKKFISLIAILGIYMPVNVFALSPEDKAALTSPPRAVALKADESNNIKWNNEHNRLLINSDFIKDFFDAEIKIDDNSIDIYKNGHTLHFEADNEFYIMDNIGGRKIDCPAEINNGTAYLPLRYICEAFGASIKYCKAEQTAFVTADSIVTDGSINKYFENVQLFDQSAVKITGEKTIYVDPRRILGEPHDADIIFITHPHNDHYETDSIRRVMNPSTTIYITEDGVEQAKSDALANVIGVLPNTDYYADGISFSTVAAYNTSLDRQNHKREFNWVGYIININGYNYYFAGDSDFTEEMKNISTPIDVAFLPIDGKYNMGPEEAAEAANAIMPKAAVPYHYNNFVSEDKAQEFTALLDEKIYGAIIAFKMQQR